jgi:hypothetical protein
MIAIASKTPLPKGRIDDPKKDTWTPRLCSPKNGRCEPKNTYRLCPHCGIVQYNYGTGWFHMHPQFGFDLGLVDCNKAIQYWRLHHIHYGYQSDRIRQIMKRAIRDVLFGVLTGLSLLCLVMLAELMWAWL